MTCMACGSKNLAGGSLTGAGDGQQIRFTFSDQATWKTLLGMGMRPVSTMACLHCGNLQLQVQFTDDDRERFATFDGPQESIVEPLAIDET